MNSSEKTDILKKAIFLSIPKFKPLKKSGVNKYFKTDEHKNGTPYSTLKDVLDSVKQPLYENGVIINFYSEKMIQDEWQGRARFTHVESGQWEEVSAPLYMKSKEMQPYGSASTYASRFNIVHYLALGSEPDDDGNSNQNKKNGRMAVDREPQLGCITRKQSDELVSFAKNKGFSIEEITNTIKNLTGKDRLGEVPTSAYEAVLSFFKNNNPGNFK